MKMLCDRRGARDEHLRETAKPAVYQKGVRTWDEFEKENGGKSEGKDERFIRGFFSKQNSSLREILQAHNGVSTPRRTRCVCLKEVVNSLSKLRQSHFVSNLPLKIWKI